MIELLLQTCVNAVYAASFMALIAVGLMLIFGVMGVVNFAHGELFMLGAYCVVFAYADHSFPFFLAVMLGWSSSGYWESRWNGPCSGRYGTTPWPG